MATKKSFDAKVTYELVQRGVTSRGDQAYMTKFTTRIGKAVISEQIYSSGHRIWEAEDIFSKTSKALADGTFKY